MLNDSRGSCGDPRQYSHCPCCQSPIESNDNTISCYLCGGMSIKTSCLGVPSQLQCGQMLWKCPECVKIRTISIFQSMLEKLKKTHNIEKDVKIMKGKLLILEPSCENVQTRTNFPNRFQKQNKPSTVIVDNGDPLNGSERPNADDQTMSSYAQAVAGIASTSLPKAQSSRNPLFHRLTRRDSVSSNFSDVAGGKRKLRKLSPVKVPVVTGSCNTNVSVKGVEMKPRNPPRRHYFISRLSNDVNEETLPTYCIDSGLTVHGCRELPSKRSDLKSFYIILPESQATIAGDSSTWPEHVILRRYSLTMKQGHG